MRVVRLGTAELVVVDTWAERTIDKVLELPAAAVVADDDVELAVGAEAKDSAVVVPPQGLARVRLERAEPDQIPVEGERRAVPVEAVDPVAEQRNGFESAGVGAGRALGPVEVDEPVGPELRVEGDAEQSALGREVDGEVQNRHRRGSAHDALHFAAVLLEHEHVAGAEEPEADRAPQVRRRLPDGQVPVEDSRQRRLRLSLCGGEGADDAERERRCRQAESSARFHGLSLPSRGHVEEEHPTGGKRALIEHTRLPPPVSPNRTYEPAAALVFRCPRES
jgi:hypothetical protein